MTFSGAGRGTLRCSCCAPLCYPKAARVRWNDTNHEPGREKVGWRLHFCQKGHIAQRIGMLQRQEFTNFRMFYPHTVHSTDIAQTSKTTFSRGFHIAPHSTALFLYIKNCPLLLFLLCYVCYGVLCGKVGKTLSPRSVLCLCYV